MMINDAESDIKHLVYPTFPDSYVKEILTISHVLWRVLGKSQYTNCVIVCGSRTQAKELYEQLKSEFLENKDLHIFDHGVTDADCDGWNIFVKNRGARISFTSYPMEPRRIRHKRRSPDLVVCYDLEESHDGNIHKWLGQNIYNSNHFYQKTILTGEINSSGNIFEQLRTEKFYGRVKVLDPISIIPCPLFDMNNKCLWEERYSEKEQKKLLKEMKDPKKEKEVQYRLNTSQVFYIPKRFVTSDGYDIEGYAKYLESRKKEDIMAFVMHEVSLKNHAEEYSLCGGEYVYYGTGKVAVYISIDD